MFVILVSTTKKKITVTPNLKKFFIEFVKLVEEVFIIGSYWRITIRQD